MRVRAFENLAYLVYVNSADPPCIGGTVAVDPKGAFLPGTPLPGPGAEAEVTPPCLLH